MDYRTCICPHCGKEVPVPDEMQAFSCIFCGSQITFSQPENPYATLWDCYFDAASYVSRMNYQEYKSAFTEYLNKCLPTLRSLDAMAAADASVAAAQAQVLVDGILSRRPEEIKGKNNYERNAIESRDQMFLALYLIPGILAAKLPSSEMLSQAVRDTWNRQYPKMKISIGTYESIAAAVFMLLIAGAVFSFVYGGMQEDKYKVWKYNRDNNPDPDAKRRLDLAGAVSGAIMLTATAIYVGLGFTRNTWGTAWWVFPVGGILCGVVHIAMNPYKGED